MMKNNFNLPLTVLETGIYDSKHNHVATTTQSQDKAMALAVNSHDDLMAMLKKFAELDRFEGGSFYLISDEVDEAKELLAKLEGKS